MTTAIDSLSCSEPSYTRLIGITEGLTVLIAMDVVTLARLIMQLIKTLSKALYLAIICCRKWS